MEHQHQSLNFPNSDSALPSTSSALTQHYTYPTTSEVPYNQYYQPITPDMGYPQPCAPPSYGQPYYPQSGVVYPGSQVPNYQPMQPQQQQQQTVVVNSQPMGVTPVFTVHPPPVSMVGAITLSCIVFWCCGCMCGGIAFILAMVGQSSAAAGDTRSAIQMRNVSYGLSIAGIAAGIIIIAVVAGIYGSAARSNNNGAHNRCYDGYYGHYYYC